MAVGAWGEGGIWLKNWQRGRNVDVGTGGEGPLLVSSVLLCSSLWGCTPRRERGKGKEKGEGEREKEREFPGLFQADPRRGQRLLS